MNKIILQFNIHIIEVSVPLLLSLADMNRLGIFYNSLTSQLVHSEAGKTTQIERFYGHPFIRWYALQHSFFTYAELKRLHKRFGHSHSDKLLNLLKGFELENIDADTRAILEDITRRCNPCQTYAQAPRRFKFALREDKDFDRSVFLDIFCIDSEPIMHILDESTRYQAARWLPKVTSEAMWRTMRLCRIDVYLGQQHVVTHDVGKQFVAKVFQTIAKPLHIDTKCVPIESPNSMT